jgi:hypothetical protein
LEYSLNFLETGLPERTGQHTLFEEPRVTRLFDELAQFIWLFDQLSKRLAYVVVDDQEFKQGHASKVTAAVALLANLDLDWITLGIDPLL